jgi:large subunit ribosomal protein L18
MVTKLNTNQSRRKRHARVRSKVSGTADRPRLCVFRSLNHIYAQIIDDISGRTLVAASSKDEDVSANVAGKQKKEVAGLVGNLVGQRALKAGIKTVIFDRGGYKYHGRVQLLADAARKAGLEF